MRNHPSILENIIVRREIVNLFSFFLFGWNNNELGLWRGFVIFYSKTNTCYNASACEKVSRILFFILLYIWTLSFFSSRKFKINIENIKKVHCRIIEMTWVDRGLWLTLTRTYIQSIYFFLFHLKFMIFYLHWSSNEIEG